MGRQAFEEAVAAAVDNLPPELGERLRNIVVLVEDEPSADDIAGAGLDPDEDTLFGLYHGTALTERGAGSDAGTLPDRIVVYRLPLLEHCASRRELLREIRATVEHEIGHYFGLDEEDLP